MTATRRHTSPRLLTTLVLVAVLSAQLAAPASGRESIRFEPGPTATAEPALSRIEASVVEPGLPPPLPSVVGRINAPPDVLLPGVSVQLLLGGQPVRQVRAEGAHFHFDSVPLGEYQFRLLSYRDDVLPLAADAPLIVAPDTGPEPIRHDLALGTETNPVDEPTPIDKAIYGGGAITGLVTYSTNGAPATATDVTVYTPRGMYLRRVTTDASGRYSITGLAQGDYKVRFGSPSTRSYDIHLPRWYGGAETIETGALVLVREGSTTTSIDGTITVGGEISGLIDTFDNFHFSTAYYLNVDVFAANGDLVKSYAEPHYSGEWGYFTVRGLPSGTYRLRASIDSSDSQTDYYLPTFYGGSPTLEGAAPISVTAPERTGLQRMTLGVGGSIEGTVRNVEGAGIPNVRVTVYDERGVRVADDTSGPSGVYSTGPGLYSGNYRLLFSPAESGAGSGYVRQFSGGAPDLASATPLLVEVRRVSMADAILVRESDALGIIRGTVTGVGSEPLRNAAVQLLDACGVLQSTTTNDFGQYTFGKLLPASYRLLFQPPSGSGYVAEYNGDSTSFNTAPQFRVEAAQTVTSDANLTLRDGGTIGGRVTGVDTGAGLASVTVRFYTPQGSFLSSTTTNSAGTYRSTFLPSGGYRLVFLPPGSGTARAYAGASLSNVIVTTGQDVQGADVTLSRGTQISGRVTGADNGQPLYDVGVYVYDSEYEYLGTSYTDTNGNYTTFGLATGSYRLVFRPIGNGYSDAYFAVQRSDVVVTAPNRIDGYNITLERGVQMAGEVRGEDGRPLDEVYVIVYRDDGMVAATDYSMSDGRYNTSALPSGNYRVKFDNRFLALPERCATSGYASEFDDDQPDLGTATPITLPQIGVLYDISAELSLTDAIHTLSGYVLDRRGAPIPDVLVTASPNGQSARTDVNGYYRIEQLRAGSYTVLASRSGYVFTDSHTVSVPLTGQLLNFSGYRDGGYAVSGKLVDIDTRRVIEGAVVTISNGSRSEQAYSRADGSYTVDGLPPGDYTLDVRRGDYEFAPRQIAIVAADREGEELEGRRNPVIVVPGIMGSFLDYNNCNVWIGLPHLACPMPIKELLMLPNLRATGAIRQLPLGVEPAVFYAPLVDALWNEGYTEYPALQERDTRTAYQRCVEARDTQKKPLLFVFAYDWRLDNAGSATELARLIDCVGTIYQDRRVNIVTHSMGGLVARRYILDNPKHNVRKLITVAAPWAGAPKALSVMESGWYNIEINGLITATSAQAHGPAPLVALTLLRDLTRTRRFAGVHQLLPSDAYVTALRGAPLREEGGEFDGVNNALPTLSFEEYRRWLDGHYWESDPGTATAAFHTVEQDDWRGDAGHAFRGNIEYYHFYGYSAAEDTVGQIRAVNRVGCASRNLEALGQPVGCVPFFGFDIGWTRGDGTVPTLSARRCVASARSESCATGQPNLNAPSATVIGFSSGDPDLVEHTGLVARNQQVLTAVLRSLREVKSPVIATSSAVSMPQADVPVLPRRYLTVVGVEGVTIADELGRTTDTLSGTLSTPIPDVSYASLSPGYHATALPLSQTYTLTLTIGAQPSLIEVRDGTGDTTSAAVRYLDLSYPAGTRVALRMTAQGIEPLRIDADANGTYEGIVQPSANVTGALASDTTPPVLTVGTSGPLAAMEVTLTANDTESGPKAIYYSVDGANFQRYSTPITVDTTQHTVMYAFAEDNVANRSSLTVAPLVWQLSLPAVGR
jgi:pimeloyl-ACP methyl ester carboxylesterase